MTADFSTSAASYKRGLQSKDASSSKFSLIFFPQSWQLPTDLSHRQCPCYSSGQKSLLGRGKGGKRTRGD